MGSKAPREEVIKAIEETGLVVSVPQIVAATGLAADEVEAQLATILRLTNGFFETSTVIEGGSAVETTFVANTMDTTHVRYVYPQGMRALLKQRLLVLRVREAVQRVGRASFAVLRVAFGVVLLLSLAIIVVVVIVVIISATRGERRGGGDLPIGAIRHIHRPPRMYGRNDIGDIYWCWWWMNANPFFQPAPMQQHYRERRALRAQLDEEEGAGIDDQEHHEEENMSFLEGVFSWLFGDGSPGPTVNEIWQTVARLIHSRDGVVVHEEVVPLLPEADGEPIKCMLPVLERFGGKPWKCEDTLGLIFDFPRMREGPLPLSSAQPSKADQNSNEDDEIEGYDEDHRMLTSTPPPGPGYLEERLHRFSHAPVSMLQLAAGLGMINLVGGLWLRGQVGALGEDMEGVMRWVSGGVVMYAVAYMCVPVVRLLYIMSVNESRRKRNERRKALLEEFNRQCADPQSAVTGKLAFIEKWRGSILGNAGMAHVQ